MNAFLAKHADIKTKAEAIFNRYKELTDRPAAVKVYIYTNKSRKFCLASPFNCQSHTIHTMLTIFTPPLNTLFSPYLHPSLSLTILTPFPHSPQVALENLLGVKTSVSTWADKLPQVTEKQEKDRGQGCQNGCQLFSPSHTTYLPYRITYLLTNPPSYHAISSPY